MNNDSESKSPTKEDEEEDDDLFFFESDHLALKGNKDYSELLKTLFVLEAQREKAIKDYEKVVEIQKTALKDPLSFIQKVKEGIDVGIPPYQRIAEVPVIDWNKFDVKIPENALKTLNSKDGKEKGHLNVTEKIYSSKKSSDTHKKPWTTEEQKRLEELLHIYPPENVELRRFKKIAAALGNRTVKQVTSRVQKYFLKLYKAGLPIPGRIPKSADKYKKSKLHVHQRHNHFLWKPSTFFPHLDIPVKMNDFEEVPGPSVSHKNAVEMTSDYLFPKSEDNNVNEPKEEAEHQLELVKRVKHVKEKELQMCLSFSHFGFKCDYCDEEPIRGARWHCVNCSHNSVDFCTDCVISQLFSTEPHPVFHRLEPVFGDTPEGNSYDSMVDESHGTSKDDKSCKTDSESSSDFDSDSITLNGNNLSESQDIEDFSQTDFDNSAVGKSNPKGFFFQAERVENYNDTSDSQSFTMDYENN